MRVFVPVPAVSEANRQEHWAKKKKRKDAQKQLTWALLRALPIPAQVFVRAWPRWRVTFVVHPSKMSRKRMDDDNLIGSVKYFRDEVCRWLGVDDGERNLVRFSVYEAPRGGEQGVEIIIEPWIEGDETNGERSVSA